MLPAVGQGVVAVECVETDWATRAQLAKIDNAPSRLSAEAEREVLWVLKTAIAIRRRRPCNTWQATS